VIEGIVNAAHEAVVTIPVQGPAGQSREVEAVIDTGFNRFLTLPPALVAELDLPFVTSGRVTLADGSQASFEVYDVTVLWDGQPRDVYTYAADSMPLLGMLLLDDHDLNIQVRDGGRVVIQAGE
jgi:clan AA aspartic protease